MRNETPAVENDVDGRSACQNHKEQIISMQISRLGVIGISHIFVRAIMQFKANDMQTHVKAVTFQILFSFFPFIVFFMALLGSFALSDVFDLLRSQSDGFFLNQTVLQINLVIDQLQQRRHSMLSLGVVFSIWASSSAMRSMMKALNVVFGVHEARRFWKRYFLSIVTTLIVGTLLAMAVTLLLIRPAAVNTLAQHFQFEPVLVWMWTWWIRWPSIILLLTTAVTTVYWFGPDVRRGFRNVAPGAFVAALAWFAASLTFDYYVRNIGGYDHLYGNVATAVVLLLYFFISSFILIFGAELNAAVEWLFSTDQAAEHSVVGTSDSG